MDRLSFWQQKIVQIFHDPPGKPLAGFPRAGGHRKLARELFQRFTGLPRYFYDSTADYATAGADRPLLTPPQRVKGISPLRITWWDEPLLTHPLAPGMVLRAVHAHELDEQRSGAPKRDLEAIELDLEEQRKAAERLQGDGVEWRDADALQRAFVRVWRRFRDELAGWRGDPSAGDPLWEEMPADTRSPDHSIWDHLRVTTALAFLMKDADPEQQPWLFRFSVGPVKTFIGHSRKTRDLWVSSFLLSDLVWHAMRPLIDQYGPDCIVYPDLRGNARADCWLAERESIYSDALPPMLEGNPCTFAAIIPESFTAILPRGGSAHLKPLEELAEVAANAVQERWLELAASVRGWLLGKIKNDRYGGSVPALERLWERQTRDVFNTSWTAVPWLLPERLQLPEGVQVPTADFMRRRALPTQRPDFRSAIDPQNLTAMVKREERLAPWVPRQEWSRYQWAREVYARTNLFYHQLERGFDYALTHHQLTVRHTLNGQSGRQPADREEHGEKCSMCGERQALSGNLPAEASGEAMDSERQAARWLWAELEKDSAGRERLCAVCSVKRYLVQAEGVQSRFNRIWAGPKTPEAELRDEDGRLRVPFPSSAALAAQEFLASLLGSPALASAIREIVRLCRSEELEDRYWTASPRALPRLAALVAEDDPERLAASFLRIEPQVLFPETIESELRQLDVFGRQGGKDDSKARNKVRDALEELLKMSKELRQKAEKQRVKKPRTHFAVLRMDGDAMHRLLLGDEEVIRARWRDVVHPDLVPRILGHTHLLDAGWGELLEAPRLMGPSLHAFISRVLADFSNRIAPWVIEREFSGRLIYAGGDDLLALLPASDALPAAARLQQLFSAGWVIDTMPHERNWDWRHRNWRGRHDPEAARRRFVIPWFHKEEPVVDLPVRWVQQHVTDQQAVDDPLFHELPTPVTGRVTRMLGPYCSLSAGIAVGHFKTALSLMLEEAGRQLDRTAKQQLQRRAAAISYFTRSGVKASFGLRWSAPGEPIQGHQPLLTLMRAFAEGDLPRRLPYKLRTLALSAHIAMAGETRDIDPHAVIYRRRQILQRFLATAVERPVSPALRDALVEVWRLGFELYPDEPERSVEGLLLCRALPNHEEGGWE